VVEGGGSGGKGVDERVGNGGKGVDEGVGKGGKGVDEGVGSGGKGVEEGGGSGDAGLSLACVVALGGAGLLLLFVVGACMWALVAIHLWCMSLLFVVGMHHCCFSLACVVALGGTVLVSSSVGGRLSLCAVVVLHAQSLFVGGGLSSSVGSVLRSGSVRFFAPKTRNRGLQPVQDRPRYCGDRTGPPRTGLLQSMQPKKTSSDRFFGVIFVVPIEIIFISTIITLKIRRNI
jgi:hypothetical protein